MDLDLNGTSFASVACSESDGGSVCHLCVGALDQALGCGWCHDIARCTKRSQCQVSDIDNTTPSSPPFSISPTSSLPSLL